MASTIPDEALGTGPDLFFLDHAADVCVPTFVALWIGANHYLRLWKLDGTQHQHDCLVRPRLLQQRAEPHRHAVSRICLHLFRLRGNVGQENQPLHLGPLPLHGGLLLERPVLDSGIEGRRPVLQQQLWLHMVQQQQHPTLALCCHGE